MGLTGKAQRKRRLVEPRLPAGGRGDGAMPVFRATCSPLIHIHGFRGQGIAINDHPPDATDGIRRCRRGASARGTDAFPLPYQLPGDVDRVLYIKGAVSKVAGCVLAEKVAKKLAGEV